MRIEVILEFIRTDENCINAHVLFPFKTEIQQLAKQSALPTNTQASVGVRIHNGSVLHVQHIEP